MTASLRRPLAVLGALLSVVIWAVNYPATKIVYRELSPLAFTGWRIVLAAAFLVAEALVRRERLVPPPGARGLALVLALSGVGVYQWLYALGLASTSGFSAALLNSVSPLIAMLFVVLLGWERMSPLAGVGSLVACATPSVRTAPSQRRKATTSGRNVDRTAIAHVVGRRCV